MKYKVKLSATKYDETYYEADVEIEANDDYEAQDMAFDLPNSAIDWQEVGFEPGRVETEHAEALADNQT